METGTRQATTEAGPEDLPSPAGRTWSCFLQPPGPYSGFRHLASGIRFPTCQPIKAYSSGGGVPTAPSPSSFCILHWLRKIAKRTHFRFHIFSCASMRYKYSNSCKPKKKPKFQASLIRSSAFSVRCSMFPPGPQCKFPVPSRQSASKYVKGGFPQQRKPFSRWHFSCPRVNA